jgi:hypothetical protein
MLDPKRPSKLQAAAYISVIVAVASVPVFGLGLLLFGYTPFFAAYAIIAILAGVVGIVRLMRDGPDR